MTETVPPRSYSTYGGIARTIPSWNTLEIKRDIYTDPMAFLEFGLFGQFEEERHSDHNLCGHIQNLRLLELHNRATLIALIEGQEDLSEAKETIVQNELACERIYRTCREFVETVDQYDVQAGAEAFAAEVTPKDDQLQFQSELGERLLANRNISNTSTYEMLEILENKFETKLVPRLAALLALNIPLLDINTEPKMRAEAITGVDIQERFDLIFLTLMDHIEANSELSESADEDTIKEALNHIHNELTNELSIEIALPGPEPLAFPLFEFPRQRGPSVDVILREFKEEIRESQRTGSLPEEPTIETVATYLVGFFDSFGCIIVHTDEGHRYFPNPFVRDEELVSNSDSHGLQLGPQYYGQELFFTYFTHNVIDQLMEQSNTNEATGLLCPFCKTDHDLQKENCTTHKARPDIPQSWSDPGQIADDLQALEAVLEEFVAAEVPGEDQLAAHRKHREIEAKTSASDSS